MVSCDRGRAALRQAVAIDRSEQQEWYQGEGGFRSLAEGLPVQIWTARPDGWLDYVTAQTARHFGLSPAQLLESGWQSVVHPDDLPGAAERWGRSLASGEPYETEFRLRLADRSYAWHLARAVVVRDRQGAIVRWLGTNTNIDEQREERRRTQALLVEVGRQARESEAALTALRRANELAEARVAELEARLKVLEVSPARTP